MCLPQVFAFGLMMGTVAFAAGPASAFHVEVSTLLTGHGKQLYTQQHWLAHNDTLFLVYTRRGTNNARVMLARLTWATPNRLFTPGTK